LSVVIPARGPVLHPCHVVRRCGPALDPGQSPPLQLAEPALRRGDDEEVGVAFLDIES
jgi:hypothetical protein